MNVWGLQINLKQKKTAEDGEGKAKGSKTSTQYISYIGDATCVNQAFPLVTMV